MNPLISLVIPIYKTEHLLDDCINSIRQQSFKNFEIICVDDCSPDDSYRIIEKHISEDSRIKLIRHEKNKGLGGARNTGILAAKSEYIASVDSDDTIKEGMLEALWNASNHGQKDIVCCGYDELNEDGKTLHSRNFSQADILNSENNRIDIFDLLNPSFWNKLWRRSLFIDNNILFPENVFFEDAATTPRVLLHAKTIKIIDKSYYNYYQREQSITSTFSGKHITDLFKAYDMVLASLIKNNVLDYYKDDFVKYIESGVRFHSQGIASSSMPQDKIDHYLQNLSETKALFLEKKLGVNDVDSVNRVKEKSLSTFQKLGSKIFALLFGVFISPTHLKKLNHHPAFFFNDSKSKFTRFIGRLLRII